MTEQIHRRAVEILDGGGWHDMEDVIADLSRLVPPGRAIRRNERDRAASGGPPTRHNPLPVEEMIRSGARSIVRELIRKQRHRAPVYETEHGKVRLVGLPRNVTSDRKNGEILLPALERLYSETPRTFRHLQTLAHDYGLHMANCPKGCRLGGPIRK